MKTATSFVIFCVAVLSTIGAAHGDAQNAQPTASDESAVLGDWRGESICVVRESACRNEDSLYHVTKLPEKPGWFSMKLDKIVGGKPVSMGTMDCSYSAAKRSLTCEFPRGIMRFTVTGNKMEGTMALPDGTQWRKLALKKSSAS
jgi:hypothetical protein